MLNHIGRCPIVCDMREERDTLPKADHLINKEVIGRAGCLRFVCDPYARQKERGTLCIRLTHRKEEGHGGRLAALPRVGWRTLKLCPNSKERKRARPRRLILLRTRRRGRHSGLRELPVQVRQREERRASLRIFPSRGVGLIPFKDI